MSNDDGQPEKDYEVGYGRPPREHQFKKGQSGNRRGRPKRSDPTEVDIESIINEPITVVQDGVAQSMPPKEVALRSLLKKAINGGDLRSMIYLLEKFEKYGVISWPEVEATHGVVVLPSSMPWPMAQIMFDHFGKPPWNERQLALGRAEYVASRTDREREIDEAIGYPDL